MIDPAKFREIALAMPEATEGSHFEAMDFRVGGKIFATWRADRQRAVVKLTPDDQRMLAETMGGMVTAVDGGWGLKGWSRLDLDRVDEAEARHVIATAWRTVAPKRLTKNRN